MTGPQLRHSFTTNSLIFRMVISWRSSMTSSGSVIITLLFSSALTGWKCAGDDIVVDPCLYLESPPDVLQENILYATNDDINIENFRNYRKRSKVCLPEPCKDLDAYSGFIPVDADNTAFLFFLHIKSKVKPARKPLLLWLQGSPGVSSLFGQFLANGPLGIDADGKLYHRTYSLIRDFNVIYLDQPAGAGYSFSEKEEYPGTLDEVALQVGRFLRRFLRIFTECRYSDFYIAGESYGARAAIAVATYIDKKTDIPLRFKGLMLGVGLVFPLMDIVDSANFLHTSGLLDEYGRRTLASWFKIIRASVKRQELAKAADELFKTVFNMPPVGQKTIFQGLTGFDHHGSIARTRQPLRVQKYFDYASSNEFKKIIHVGSDMALDKARREVAMQLAIGNFFEDIEKKVKRIFETTRVLFYTAQMDAVFPAANIEQSLKDLPWSWQETLRTARRKPWYRNDNSSLELFGYEFKVGTFTYNKLLGGGHDVSMDQSEAVCEMFSRFLKSRRS